MSFNDIDDAEKDCLDFDFAEDSFLQNRFLLTFFKTISYLFLILLISINEAHNHTILTIFSFTGAAPCLPVQPCHPSKTNPSPLAV